MCMCIEYKYTFVAYHPKLHTCTVLYPPILSYPYLYPTLPCPALPSAGLLHENVGQDTSFTEVFSRTCPGRPRMSP